jgi:hypothetical protein
VALGATAVVLGGCSAPPEVSPAPSADHPACARPAWPASVSGLGRVATSPELPSVGAWGEPAIIARCGVPALAPTTLECVTVNGVDWVVRPLSDGSAATTYGTDPAIEVLVPAKYGAAGLHLPVFAPVAEGLPHNGRRCV